MKRKLVKQGTATLMVSLPAKWLRDNSLEKGSEIDIEESEKSLVISTKGSDVKKEISIQLNELTESTIRTFITNTYRKGFDKINVTYKDNKQFQILNKVIKTRLIGFEIIKKSDKSCIVENITEPSSDQFNNILSKLFLSIDELFEITHNFLNNNLHDNFEETEERIQKYDNFCRRVISKQRISGKNSELMWTFLSLLIHGQRDLYHLLKNYKSKTKVTKETLSYLDSSKKIYEMLKQAYLKKSISDLEKIHTIEKDLVYKTGHSLMLKEKNPIAIHYISNSIRQFYLATSPLMGMVLNSSF